MRCRNGMRRGRCVEAGCGIASSETGWKLIVRVGRACVPTAWIVTVCVRTDSRSQIVIRRWWRFVIAYCVVDPIRMRMWFGRSECVVTTILTR